MTSLRFWLTPPPHVLLALVVLALFGSGAVVGRWTAPATPARIVTVTETKERIVWQAKTETAAATTATAEKRERVRVVTRWLRPDGTVSKEQERGSTSTASTAASTTARTHSQTSGETARASESRTVVDLRPPARFHVQALLGLDLGAGLARRYGGSVAVRVVGPVSLVAVAFPGAKLYGMGVGITW